MHWILQSDLKTSNSKLLWIKPKTYITNAQTYFNTTWQTKQYQHNTTAGLVFTYIWSEEHVSFASQLSYSLMTQVNFDTLQRAQALFNVIAALMTINHRFAKTKSEWPKCSSITQGSTFKSPNYWTDDVQAWLGWPSFLIGDDHQPTLFIKHHITYVMFHL